MTTHNDVYHSLPEHTLFRDDGCQVSPSCLRCPLPRCKYDGEPGWYHRERRSTRDEEIRRLRRLGLHPQEIARRHDVTVRTVYRALQKRGQETLQEKIA